MEEISVMRHNSEQPFHVVMGTSMHLVVIDLRQSSEPLLEVAHHLSDTPLHLSIRHISTDTSKKLCSHYNIKFMYVQH